MCYRVAWKAVYFDREGEKFTLPPLYLGSLYAQLDEGVPNVVRSVGRYYAVTHVDLYFL